MACFHPSDAYLGAGDVAGTVRVWDGRWLRLTHVYRRPGVVGGVTAIEWCPRFGADSVTLAVGYEDRRVEIRDLTDDDGGGERRRRRWTVRSVEVEGGDHHHVSTVTGMAWSANGKLLVTVSRDEIVHVWGTTTTPTTKPATNDGRKRHRETTVYARLCAHPAYEWLEGVVSLPPPPSSSDDDGAR